MFEMGFTLKDKITGFKGVVAGRCEYITGCDQYLVQPKTDNGKWVDSRWLDENRLEAVEGSELIVLDTSKEVGACCEAPRK